MVFPQILVDFQSISIGFCHFNQFQSVSISFSHFESISISLTRSKTQEFIDNRKVGKTSRKQLVVSSPPSWEVVTRVGVFPFLCSGSFLIVSRTDPFRNFLVGPLDQPRRMKNTTRTNRENPCEPAIPDWIVGTGTD